MKIRPLKAHFYSIGWVRNNERTDLQMLSFYSSRHHPFIKQVHSQALITILALTEAISAFFGLVNRKEINTEYGFS
ncbi:TPA: hypothetical protein O8U57_000610 [Enterobacter asburiae]|uniref:hypothetical protein n=1 Tax=Enterobacter cloacae complex TaxID=354276 RepID=UPI0009BD9984|nr:MULTISPECIES: hypothetical protein [Enterobacter cloacae complex]POV41484.1 hypothetical protein C3397_18225 [Enterobacter cloacae complex sp. ECNIH16]POV42230.1 hypothetical protein C3394_07225 [Enterobacter cloacae complex sp. ECNIH11]HBM7599209.1 hypothetical protein [Enterobacter asburiae]HBM7609650.1 hypothetical protein [Enterobacter asburiae]HBM7634527.1 hypothetical protein [Enterobacter asburiae]